MGAEVGGPIDPTTPEPEFEMLCPIIVPPIVPAPIGPLSIDESFAGAMGGPFEEEIEECC